MRLREDWCAASQRHGLPVRIGAFRLELRPALARHSKRGLAQHRLHRRLRSGGEMLAVTVSKDGSSHPAGGLNCSSERQDDRGRSLWRSPAGNLRRQLRPRGGKRASRNERS
jgi:hypothetical protein